MAAPVINTTQSVLGFLQWQPWEYQPYATNTPTTWTASTLPPGISLNASTGKLSGAASKPGVYVVTLRAKNGDGTSAGVVFTIGIEASSPTAGSDLDVTFDMITRRITLTRPDPLASGVELPAIAGADGEINKAAAICTVKEEDDLIFRLRFVKNGVVVDPAVTALKFSLKELEPDVILVESVTADWFRQGTGADATFRLYVKLTGSALKGALANYEEDASTEFPALAEFKVVFTNPDDADLGPSTLRRTASGLILIQRQQEA